MDLASLWDPLGRSSAPPGDRIVAHGAHEDHGGHKERKVLIVNDLICIFCERGVFVGSIWSELRTSQGRVSHNGQRELPTKGTRNI